MNIQKIFFKIFECLNANEQTLNHIAKFYCRHFPKFNLYFDSIPETCRYESIICFSPHGNPVIIEDALVRKNVMKKTICCSV